MRFYRDKLLLTLSAVSAGIAFVIYCITRAPTVSFWDCGEFIASAFTLGIPHPPGYPVFVILGRAITLLPISSEIAGRVNLLSVLGAVAAVFTAYWLIVRIILGSRQETTAYSGRLAVGIGALAGSLILAFSDTFWSNAVEAEVYTLSMFLMLLVSHLALLWAHNQDWKERDRLLILISYLMWLSLGIHMTTFILMLPMILFLAYEDYKASRLIRWPVWLVMALFILYALPLQVELLFLTGIDLSRYELESFIAIFSLALIIVTTVSIVGKTRESKTAAAWKLAAFVMLAALAGFSSQAYLPVRAANNPVINENDPDNWSRFKGLLERKQYGQESMIRRMFKRRGSWQRQLISDPRFGLWAAFSEQYASPRVGIPLQAEDRGQGKTPDKEIALPLPALFVLIGLYGAYTVARRAPPEGLFILGTFLLCTVGLVVYMNFSDGTYNPALAPVGEVRNRDYFYTPGFMYFAVIIGLGLAYLLQGMERVSSRGPSPAILRKILFYMAISAALLMPVVTLASNFDRNDRRGNYLPRDYAFNILNSCDQDAILFTNGDNDTFPLWYLQLVEGIRTDVRVVNLSLLNTVWYIHQIKDQMNLPISMRDQDIDGLRAAYLADRNEVWRIQDQMVEHIVTNIHVDGWRVPVYFAITVPGDNRLGLDDHLVMAGMVYRVVESSGQNRVNTSVGNRIFSDPRSFRGLDDPGVYKSENDYRLIANYAIAMLQLADAYRRDNRPDSAAFIAERAVQLQGDMDLWQAKALLAGIYAQAGRFDDIIPLARGSARGEMIFLAASQDLIKNQRNDDAIRLLKITLSEFPFSFTALNNLAAIYYQNGDTAEGDRTIAEFRDRVRGDSLMISKLDQTIERLGRLPEMPGR